VLSENQTSEGIHYLFFDVLVRREVIKEEEE